jgi:hypothetical protein
VGESWREETVPQFRRRGIGGGGLTNQELISIEKQVELLRREKAQMENEAKYRRFQRDPIGTHFGEMTPARRRERERELREKNNMKARADASAFALPPPPSSAVVPRLRTEPLPEDVVASRRKRTDALLRKFRNLG